MTIPFVTTICYWALSDVALFGSQLVGASCRPWRAIARNLQRALKRGNFRMLTGRAAAPSDPLFGILGGDRPPGRKQPRLADTWSKMATHPFLAA
jgi:hypothetical protein